MSETVLSVVGTMEITELTFDEITQVSGSSNLLATQQVSEYPEIENDPPG